MFNSFRRDAGRVSFRFNFLASCDKKIAGRLAHFFAIRIDNGNRQALGERTALHVLVLPSAISPADPNFLLNPEYPQFRAHPYSAADCLRIRSALARTLMQLLRGARDLSSGAKAPQNIFKYFHFLLDLR